jgi:hypothetical protein
MAPRKLWSSLLTLPLVNSSPLPLSSTSSACSQIKSSLQPIPGVPASSTILGQVPADLAWSCLHSIPLNVTAALDLVESLKPYVAFQSSIGFIKNPPAEYKAKIQGPVDVFGELDRISDKVRNSGYDGEYEVSYNIDLRSCVNKSSLDLNSTHYSKAHMTVTFTLSQM